MKHYRVVWEIDVDAEDAVQAAKLARELQLVEDSTAVVFDVISETGIKVCVDLLEEDGI
jgi:hypothetical protein